MSGGWVNWLVSGVISTSVPFNAGLSNDFINFIKSINDAKSKQEEDRLIENELKSLKTLISHPISQPSTCSDPDPFQSVQREIVIRMMFCELLGHRVTFGHIFAINMTQNSSLGTKRLGYLASVLLLSESNDLSWMLISSITRDLKSSNVGDIYTALVTLSHFIRADAIPAVVELVSKLLSHQKPLIRRKAISALHRFYDMDSDSVEHLQDSFRMMLCDKDPTVMAATLPLFYSLVKKEPQRHKDLVSIFVSILKQIGATERASMMNSTLYEHKGVSLPWAQLLLLRILRVLGHKDKKASSYMYTVLQEVLEHSEKAKTSMGYTIIYECVQTIVNIIASDSLLTVAATAVSKFVQSTAPNLRYVGIKCLNMIVEFDMQYAITHQYHVISALQESDMTIKRMTLNLLCNMCVPSNVEVITNTMLPYLKGDSSHAESDSTEVSNTFQHQLANNLLSIALRCAISYNWFVDTVVQILYFGGNFISESSVYSVLAVFMTKNETIEDLTEIRRYALHTVLNFIDQHSTKRNSRSILPLVLVYFVLWIIGSYAELAISDWTPRKILDLVNELMQTQLLPDDSHIFYYYVSCICKLAARDPKLAQPVLEILESQRRSRNTLTQQLSNEMVELFSQSSKNEIIDLESSNYFLGISRENHLELGELQMDPNLAFLDHYISKYGQGQPIVSKFPQKVIESDKSSSQIATRKLRFAEYESPKKATVTLKTPAVSLPPQDLMTDVKPSQPVEASIELNLKAKTGKWGPQGYVPAALPKETTEAPTQKPIDESSTTLVTNSQIHPKSPSKRHHTVTAPPFDIERERMRSAIFDSIQLGGPQGSILSGSKLGQSGLFSSRVDMSPVKFVPKQPINTLTQSTSIIMDRKKLIENSVAEKLAGSVLQPTQPSQLLEMEPVVRPTMETPGTYGGHMIVPQQRHVLQHEIRDKPRSHEQDMTLITDNTMAISFVKVYQENSTLVVVFHKNFASQELTNVDITVDVPSNVKATALTDEAINEFPTNDNSLKFQIKVIPAGQTVLCAFRVSLSKWSVQMNMKSKALYHIGQQKQERQLSFTVVVEPADFLRNYHVSLAQFELYWADTQGFCHERVLPVDTFTVPELSQILQRKLYLYAQHKDNDLLCCGRSIDGALLVLVKVETISEQELKYKITVRTKEFAFAESVTRNILKYLEERKVSTTTQSLLDWMK